MSLVLQELIYDLVDILHSVPDIDQKNGRKVFMSAIFSDREINSQEHENLMLHSILKGYVQLAHKLGKVEMMIQTTSHEIQDLQKRQKLEEIKKSFRELDEISQGKGTEEEIIEADILIVTVTKVESRAVIDVFEKATRQTAVATAIDDRVYHNIGVINGKRVFMVQSEMGSGGLGASLQTVQKGINALSPKMVIMVGIAFGINADKQSIGDILVSQQLMLYELQRVGTKEGTLKIILRGDRPHASSGLINLFKSADLYWDESKGKVRFGLILSGEKLVDNADFQQQLREFELEAVGGEMEGAGLYVACQDARVDWILVKSICDWADGNKAENKDAQQSLAAHNAASFVLHGLRHASDLSTSSTDSENVDDRLDSKLENILNVAYSAEKSNPDKALHLTGPDHMKSLGIETDSRIRVQQFRQLDNEGYIKDVGIGSNVIYYTIRLTEKGREYCKKYNLEQV